MVQNGSGPRGAHAPAGMVGAMGDPQPAKRDAFIDFVRPPCARSRRRREIRRISRYDGVISPLAVARASNATSTAPASRNSGKRFMCLPSARTQRSCTCRRCSHCGEWASGVIKERCAMKRLSASHRLSSFPLKGVCPIASTASFILHAVAIDAQRGDVCAADFDLSEQGPRLIVPLRILSAADSICGVETLIGPEATRWASSAKVVEVAPRSILKAARDCQRVAAPEFLEPIYLRPVAFAKAAGASRG